MPIPTELFATMTERLVPGNGAGTAIDAIVVWRAVFKKLGPLIGPLSTELLFARTLASHESAFPWLPQAAPGATRSVFADFERCLDGRPFDEVAAVNRALLSSYTEVLASLIGAGLTVRFLEAISPYDDTVKTARS